MRRKLSQIESFVKKIRVTVIVTAAPFILGVLASVCIVVTSFSMSRNVILLTTLLTSVLTGAQYIFLNAPVTVFLVGLAAAYSLLLMAEKHLPFVRTHAFTGAVIAAQVAGYLFFEGFAPSWGLLPLAGSIVGNFALWFRNPLSLKLSMLLMGGVWLSYQLVSGAYGQLAGEFVFIAGILYSLFMLNRARKHETPLDAVEELPVMLRRKLTERKALAYA